MNLPRHPEQGRESARLEILRSYKEHLVRQGEVNASPFTPDRVIRYDSRVREYDVPDIHRAVRDRVVKVLQGIHEGHPSQVVILAGSPGMGKSHLINHFRDPKHAEEMGYVLVCNSNHWKVNEFEACLLDWILEALVRPSPAGPHLLLQKIQDVAFEALRQILAQPGQLARFEGRRGFWGAFLGKLARGHDRFQRRIQTGDVRVFHDLHFPRFAGYVCDRFLHDSGNPFHRYVLRVLLRYLFEDERERVLHWLRRKEVDFSDTTGAREQIDANYKVIDTIKILISLFTAEVSRNLSPAEADDARGKVFFFAFDQMEGRKELFESHDDWAKFFAQLSELYNTLPNVFILFTMTLALRQRLYPEMEGQFKDRISRDPVFNLHAVPDDEVLALYRKRVDHWLGDALPEVREKLASLGEPYLPFSQEEVLEISRQRTLRETLEALDERFCAFLTQHRTKPRLDYLACCKAFRPEEDDPRGYTEGHVQQVKDLFDRAGTVLAPAFGMTFVRTDWRFTAANHRVLWLEFRDPRESGQWVCVFLALLPPKYNVVADGCIELLKGKRIRQHFLWMVKPEKVSKENKELEGRRSGQVFVRLLPAQTHTAVGALLHLLEKRGGYEEEEQALVDEMLREEVKGTYLGEMFGQVREALAAQQGAAPSETEADLPQAGDAGAMTVAE